MAYTSIIPVSRLDNSITYIRNKDKTTKKGQSAGSLEEAIDYAMNRDKTERSVFEDAIGCVCETAYQDMVATKKRYHKMDGVQGYHLVQSFVKGEVTPELAHQIGMELAERLLQRKYEAVITTHLNTEHYHNHIVFNSVSMEDGKKYHSNSRSYYEDVRKASDALCLKYGLSVIEPKNGKGKSYAQWMAEQDGKPTWRTSIRLDIRDAVAESFTWKQFLEQMKQRGYQWKLNRKYIALKAPGMERYIRLRSLGKHYSEESIRQWILQPKSRIPAGKEGDSRSPKKKLKGIQALYYSYLYQMGALKQKPKRISPVLRADIRKLDARIGRADPQTGRTGRRTDGENQTTENRKQVNNMNYGGDAADQIVRYSLDGVDHGLRLSGTLAKHLAVFVAAVLKDQKKTRGKTRMVRMLKENKPLKFFTVPSDRLREFCSEGRKRGLLYVIIRDKKNPEMSEVMVFADDAAKVNRVMDKMNLDFVRSEVGEAVHEVTAGMEAPETEAVQETVQMPEGEVQFEISDLDEAFQVGDMDFSEEEKNQNHPEKEFSEPENFIPVQEEGEENLSGSSLHSRNISTGQEKGTDAGQREQERPSVRRELENIKREKAEESQKRSREKNRGPRKTQKKARNKRKVKAR